MKIFYNDYRKNVIGWLKNKAKKDTFPAFSEIVVDESTYEKFLNMKLESLQTLVKTVYLRNEDDVLVHNNGTGKIIAILAVSLILGLLGIVNKF